ncbi:MAG: phosphoribosylglycinamide formyltransferase [Chloroflexi bacterium HGW-Chloroflexi-10]|nr:MAG: phosphoribosylglycinamide formyltransferase [Chloroflexi bacterium HGW-Chloroflexi-10]
MRTMRLVVLVSGNGTNLQAILDAVRSGELNARLAVVISNKQDAYGLERARTAGVPAVVKEKTRGQERAVYDAELAHLVGSYQPDWVVLAGWMRILSMPFISRFPNRIINLHPALPGAFPGVDAIERAFQAYQQGKISHTGVMVHLVPDEGVDSGPLLNQCMVPIFQDDTLETLQQKIHACEHVVLVETLKKLAAQMEDDDAKSFVISI